MLDSKALEERSGRVESIFDPLIVTVGGIPRLIGGRRRCQVWSLSSQPLSPSDEEGAVCSYPLSSGRGAWTGGQKDSLSDSLRTSPWLVLSCGHWLRLCLHGPTDSSGNSGCEWELRRRGLHSSHAVALFPLCFVELTPGARAERHSINLLEDWTFQWRW